MYYTARPSRLSMVIFLFWQRIQIKVTNYQHFHHGANRKSGPEQSKDYPDPRKKKETGKFDIRALYDIGGSAFVPVGRAMAAPTSS